MKWRIKSRVPEEFVKKFPEYSPLVLQLLYNRGLNTQKEVDEFFNPDYLQDLHDPFLMLGIKDAVERIKKAISKKEKIAIYADYDCDGVCGAVILESAIKEIGGEVAAVYIPDKATEGYGLNTQAIEGLKNMDIKLIITVDCGISNHKEIDFANSLNIEVIIVDHHQLVNGLPKAIVIDPYQPNEKYPYVHLSGAGVAFKLAQALIRDNESKTPEGWEKWLLDLVALATIADMVPLLGENRTLVKYGLVVLAQTKRIGLKELMKVAKINPVLEIRDVDDLMGIDLLALEIEAGMRRYATNLTARMLGFILAPRLNAASRMEHANLAYQLLTSESLIEAQEIARKLDNLNSQRQNLVENIVQEIEMLDDWSKKKVIFAASNNWPIGVNGLVAGKLTTKYHRPAFVFTIEGEKAKGSIRSVPPIDIIDLIKKCDAFLEGFGGHSYAAGCRLETKNLKVFNEALEKTIGQEFSADDLIPVLDIDYELKTEEIDWKIHDEIKKFAPFGYGNPRPLFLLKRAEIRDLRTVGNDGKHLRMELKIANNQSQTEKNIQAIAFDHGIKFEDFKVGDKVDIAFELLANEWNRTRKLQLKVIDIKRS